MGWGGGACAIVWVSETEGGEERGRKTQEERPARIDGKDAARLAGWLSCYSTVGSTGTARNLFSLPAASEDQ